LPVEMLCVQFEIISFEDGLLRYSVDGFVLRTFCRIKISFQ